MMGLGIDWNELDREMDYYYWTAIGLDIDMEGVEGRLDIDMELDGHRQYGVE